MPPLPELLPPVKSAMVPIVRRMEPNPSANRTDKGKARISNTPQRQYGDEPISFKLPSEAPQNARIVHRNMQNHIATYQLEIGGTTIEDVGLDEILEWVSAADLEKFEHARFAEEIEMDRVLEHAKQERKLERLARMKQRAKTKGTVYVEKYSDSDGGSTSGQSDTEPDVVVGKHGRARPTYSQFYKQPRGKGKEIFDDFGETIEDQSTLTDVDGGAPGPSANRHSISLQDLPRRRRRKRDPITGELLPLDNVAQLPPNSRDDARETSTHSDKYVRPRRRRHPLTGELMPLGWRYDAEAEENGYENRRAGQASEARSASFQRLSISEQPAKRPRLDDGTNNRLSSSPAPTKAEIMGRASNQATPGHLRQSQTSVIDLGSSDESDAGEQLATFLKQSTPSQRRPQQAGNSMMQGIAISTASTSVETSPEPADLSIQARSPQPNTTPRALQRSAQAPPAKTSTLSPSGAHTSTIDLLSQASESEASESEIGEGEWFIESILGHQLSDIRTHPQHLGDEPVMLYSVKWEGFDDPTWEPMESFGDRKMLDDYRKKAGLPPLDDNGEIEQDSGSAQQGTSSKAPPAGQEDVDMQDGDDSESDEEEYEIEKILAHHKSDPRTHPGHLGKEPVMLFEVKWKGFKDSTWEPEASFVDSDVLTKYKQKVGLTDRAGGRRDVGLVGRLLT